MGEKMKKPWDIIGNIGENLYVIDMDTYEIVFMNEKARQVYGYGQEEVAGKKCYEVIHGRSEPCHLCNNRDLMPEEFVEQTQYNEKVDKNYSVQDTMLTLDGKNYRMQLAIDISAAEKQKKEIQIMKFTQEMIDAGFRRALNEMNAETAIGLLLAHIGQGTRSDRAYIFESKDTIINNTYEWCKDGVEAEKEVLQKIPIEDLHMWYERFEKGESVISPDIEEWKDTYSAIYHYLKPQNVRSIVASPLVLGNEIIGFFGVDNPSPEMVVYISHMAWIVAHFITALLRKRDLVNKLERLSYHDQLTGFLNRHALDIMFHSDDTHMQVGVIYCDVMGLKHINDTKGHTEGDEWLLKAGDYLKKRFRSTDIYRVGGDEFLVLCIGMAEKEFYKRLEALKADMEEGDRILAVGYLWRESTTDIESLVIEADELMYRDKRSHYCSLVPRKQ